MHTVCSVTWTLVNGHSAEQYVGLKLAAQIMSVT